MITGAATAPRASAGRTPKATRDMTLRDRRRQSRAVAERRTGAASAEAYSRVDNAVHQVDGEINEDVDDAHEEHEALDGAGVLRHHGRDGIVADARPGEHRFHHDVAGHEETKHHAEERDDRNHAVPERVAVHDGAAGPPPPPPPPPLRRPPPPPPRP